tara:strand:+ start:381 stop:575 length:195 start_codon:yes stop_codon:yes gene_type:complete
VVAVETGVVVVHLPQHNQMVDQVAVEKVQVVTQTTQQLEDVIRVVVAVLVVLVLAVVELMVDQV